MDYQFFQPHRIKTLEDLKKQFFQLAKQYHPDKTGRDTNKEMARINSEYQDLFKKVSQMRYNHKDHTFYEEKEPTSEAPKEFINIINKLIKYSDIEIAVIGSWLWVSKNTYPIKDILKSLGFKYAKNKQAWYLHYEVFRKRSKSKFDLEDIKKIFGATYFSDDEKSNKKLIK